MKYLSEPGFKTMPLARTWELECGPDDGVVESLILRDPMGSGSAALFGSPGLRAGECRWELARLSQPTPWSKSTPEPGSHNPVQQEITAEFDQHDGHYTTNYNMVSFADSKGSHHALSTGETYM